MSNLTLFSLDYFAFKKGPGKSYINCRRDIIMNTSRIVRMVWYESMGSAIITTIVCVYCVCRMHFPFGKYQTKRERENECENNRNGLNSLHCYNAIVEIIRVENSRNVLMILKTDRPTVYLLNIDENENVNRIQWMETMRSDNSNFIRTSLKTQMVWWYCSGWMQQMMINIIQFSME